ncbi:hypothetical protein NW762_002293 [Fusarium torreyae]|uniref:Uncharacterized protein n=1 Tax=Fusarium torreyae TaxID=1237075 RepID=A0A9W8SBR6_9HYPO|nr:hypothetical protein NW762_002293 [Fusarium torreyae]
MSISNPEAECTQNIALLYYLGRIGCRPQRNSIDGCEAVLRTGTGRTLSLQDERLLTSTLAFLSSIRDDPLKIMAVCVEEKKAGLVVMVAANAKDSGNSSPYLDSVKQGFDRIFELLQQASLLSSKSLSSQVLSAIVSMCRSRILSRARIIKRGQKQRIDTILKAVKKEMARFTMNDAKRQFITLSQVLMTEMEAFQKNLTPNSSSTSTSDKHLELIVKTFDDICKIPTLETMLLDQVGPRMEPDLCRGLLNTIKKLAHYHSSACTLTKLAKRNPLFGVEEVSIAIVRLHPSAFIRSPQQKATKGFELGEHLKELKKQHKAKWNIDDLCHELESNKEELRAHYKTETSEPRIHAEIQLIWYLERHPSPKPPRVIASNKDACFLCNAFISCHGKHMIPRTHGKIYPGWRLPSEGLDDARRRFPKELERIAVERVEMMSREGFKKFCNPLESNVSLAVVSVSTGGDDTERLEHLKQTETCPDQNSSGGTIVVPAQESGGPVALTPEPMQPELSSKQQISEVSDDIQSTSEVGSRLDKTISPETYRTRLSSTSTINSKPLAGKSDDTSDSWKQVKKDSTKRIRLSNSLSLHIEYTTSDPCTSQFLKFKARRLSVKDATIALEKGDPIYDLNALTTKGGRLGNCQQIKMRAGAGVYVVDLDEFV